MPNIEALKKYNDDQYNRLVTIERLDSHVGQAMLDLQRVYREEGCKIGNELGHEMVKVLKEALETLEIVLAEEES